MSGAATVARVLAGDPAVERDRTAERILDAALIEGAAKGLDRVTMDAVAARARVGRMTVYRRFSGREDLVSALISREVTRGLARIAGAVDPADDVPTQVADGFVATIAAARSHPLLQRVSRYEPEVLLAAVRDPDGELFALLRRFGAERIRAGADSAELRDDPETIAELLVRIGLSYLLIPEGAVDVQDPDSARRLARTLIAPIVSSGPA
jgi:AcrR family transcriptional regulator